MAVKHHPVRKQRPFVGNGSGNGDGPGSDTAREQQLARIKEALDEVYGKYRPLEERLLHEKPAGWQRQFRQLRNDALQEASQVLAPIYAESPDLLKPEDWKPRAKGTYKPRDFRSSLLLKDPENMVYLIALVLDPGQGSSPHDHNSLFFTHVYKGGSEEVIFNPATKEETKRVRHQLGSTSRVHGYGHKDNMHTVYNPSTPSLRPTRENMTVQLHLYDGYNLKCLQEKGELASLMPPEKEFPTAVHGSYEIPRHLSPITKDWVLPPGCNSTSPTQRG